MSGIAGAGNSYSSVLTEDIMTRLAGMLGYPRAGGRRDSRRNLWYRRHKLVHERHFARAVQRKRPIAPAIYRFIDDGEVEPHYEPLQKWCALDFDVKGGWDNPKASYLYGQMWTYVEKIDELWRKWGLNPGLTHSGSKGYHLWLFFDKEVEAKYIRGLMRQTAEELDLDIRSGKFILPEWVDDTGEVTGKKGQFMAEIDPMDKRDDSDGGIVKAPLSHHQGIVERMEMPILVEHMRDYEPVDWPSLDEVGVGVEVFRTWSETDSKFVTDFFNPQDRVFSHGPKRSATKMKSLPLFDFSGDGEKQEDMLELADTLPCLRTAVHRSSTKEVPYWLRPVIVGIFTNFGYSRREIAIFIRDHVNDVSDNLNLGVMHYQVNYWSQLAHVATCRTLQNVNGNFFCCENPCDRDSPTDSISEIKGVMNIPPEIGKTIKWELERARKEKGHRIFYKTTRSKMTTTTIRDCLINDEKLAYIAPHTKITETVQKAFDLYYELAGMDEDELGGYPKYDTKPKYGAILPDNREGCWRLKNQIMMAKDTWKSEDPALKKLPVVYKPSCADCPLRDKHLDLIPGKVLTESDWAGKKCLLATVMSNLDMFDVIMTTDKKLHALVISGNAVVDMEYEGKSDSIDLLDWIGSADVILFDEVSMYVDVPSIALPIYKVHKDKRETVYDIIEYILDQLRQVGDYKHDESFETMRELIEEMVKEFLHLSKRDGISVYRRDAETTEIEVLTTCIKRLQTIARTTNVAHIEMAMATLISPESEWIIVEEPDQSYKKIVSVYISPKFGEIHSEFLDNTIARIIVTDATMPLVDIGELLDKDFEKVNLGDPDLNTIRMRMIPYQKKYSAYDMSSKAFRGEFIAHYEAVSKIFDEDNTVYATTNSKEAYRFIKFDLEAKSQVIWYRGADSIGVDNYRRVMVGVGAPYTPKGALNWKKDVLYPELLRDYSHDAIWKYDADRALHQTSSRVKDAHGEDRSVFIGFGIVKRELERLRANCVGVPDILDVVYTRDKLLRPILPAIVAGFYYHFGEVLTPEEQLAAGYFWIDPECDLDSYRFRHGGAHSRVDGDRLRYLREIVKRWLA